MTNTKQQAKNILYIDFESLENYYKMYIDFESNCILSSKKNPLKNILEQFKENKIYFITSFKELYYNLYNNNDFMILILNDYFITYNFNNDNFTTHILNDLIENEKDFIYFISDLLNELNIKYNDNILNDILTNFIELNN